MSSNSNESSDVLTDSSSHTARPGIGSGTSSVGASVGVTKAIGTVEKILFPTICVLWMIWGAVHVFAGIATMARPAGEAVAGIADKEDADAIEALVYASATGAILNQHGFNLFWIGLGTLVCAPFCWRQSRLALWIAALLGGPTDMGYFIFLDIGGFVNFFPGTIMTIFSYGAIFLSLYVDRTAVVSFFREQLARLL